MVCGDFNNTPSELENTPWLKLLGGSVVVPQNVNHTCSSSSGRLIDYLIIPQTFRPLLKAVRPEHDVPWAPHIGIVVELRARPATITVRKPMLPATNPIPMVGVRKEKGIKRKQRDRQPYNDMQQYFNDDTLDEKLLDTHFVENRPKQRDHDIWDDCREQERQTNIRGPPQWAQNSPAYRQNPRMSTLLGRLYGKWANAAERALATITDNPIKTRARRRQPVKYVEIPYPQHIAGTPKGDTKVDQQQKVSTLWSTLHQSCKDGILLLQRHPVDGAPQLQQVCELINIIADKLGSLDDTGVAETDYLDQQAVL